MHSYHVLDSLDYRNVDQVIEIADCLLKDPLLSEGQDLAEKDEDGAGNLQKLLGVPDPDDLTGIQNSHATATF